MNQYVRIFVAMKFISFLMHNGINKLCVAVLVYQSPLKCRDIMAEDNINPNEKQVSVEFINSWRIIVRILRIGFPVKLLLKLNQSGIIFRSVDTYTESNDSSGKTYCSRILCIKSKNRATLSIIGGYSSLMGKMQH
jgi:hypothetical protein